MDAWIDHVGCHTPVGADYTFIAYLLAKLFADDLLVEVVGNVCLALTISDGVIWHHSRSHICSFLKLERAFHE